MNVLDGVLRDLAEESEWLDSYVSGLPSRAWLTVTTPEGWTVAHQIGHLHDTDALALAAVVDPEAFAKEARAASDDPASRVDAGADELAQLGRDELMTRWRAGRSSLASALADTAEGRRIPWFGPSMGAASMATARLMETWAHAHDVVEATGGTVVPTPRARHVCHLGVRARDFAHASRGELPPEGDVRVELTGPDGDLWTWGDPSATDRVTGQGHDFALLATRRRHLDDVDVHAEGPTATHWLTLVQAFAGPAGNDPVRLADRYPSDRDTATAPKRGRIRIARGARASGDG
ncbi:TIGR03084 family metal-binding protein [Streptomyces sp900105755]|uniref:TIGR03084 family metal-binding protein n=1 Tax=Streptomyces sp. 900105755 TaxID=3154389 RepID=A0ABV1TAA9_9ACTN